MNIRATIVLIGLLLLGSSCTDIGSFTTRMGECYRGKITGADFVRTGFHENVHLSLTLDTDALADGRGSAGMLWTGDQLFSAATISQMEELAHDSLSQFQFPGGRIRNYLVYVMASDGSPAMVVISLMENEQVEVRVMRPEFDPCAGEPNECDAPAIDALFGVFRLTLDEDCTIPEQE